MMGSFFTRGLVMILGYLYPAYACFKSVERNKPEIEELNFWCQYWILVAMLTVFERVGDTFMSWLPMYGEAKLAFFIYLWYPKTKGTNYVYQTFFRPYISKHETEIDRNLIELRVRAGDMAVHYWQRAASYGQTRVFEILQYVASQSSSARPAQNPPNAQPPRAVSADRTHQPLQAASPRQSRTSGTNSQRGTIQEPPPPSPSSATLLQSKHHPSDPGPRSPSVTTGPSAASGSPEPPTGVAVLPRRSIIAERAATEMALAVISSDKSSSATEDVNMEDAIRTTRGRLRKNRAGKQNNGNK